MLVWGIEHLLSHGLADLPRAWEMASTRPATLLGLAAAGGLTPGAPADFVLLRRDGNRIHIEGAFKAGQQVYASL